MKYMGSKSRITKHIVPIIQEYIDKNNIDTYIEPFVGGANVIDKIRCENKIGCDIHEYLIEMFKNLDKIATLPSHVTKEHYSDVRECFNKGIHSKYEKWYIGAIGFLASYNGRFFCGGYAGIVKTKSGTVRNYYDEAKRNLETQIPNLLDIEFNCMNYKDVEIEDSLIYCDPPYQGKKKYGINKSFDHDEFWQWVRDMSKDNIVIVSECQAPDDFECIWQQDVLRTIDNTKRVKSVEKLFIYKQ